MVAVLEIKDLKGKLTRIGMNLFFGGIPVYESNIIGPSDVQKRFPKSKKKRIRRKWLADPGNFEECLQVVIMPTGVFVPPAIYQLLQREIKGENYGESTRYSY